MSCPWCRGEVSSAGACLNLACPSRNPTPRAFEAVREDETAVPASVRIRELEEALQKYGGHLMSCDAYARTEVVAGRVHLRVCTCGFDAVSRPRPTI